jgi:hypothetical protein
MEEKLPIFHWGIHEFRLDRPSCYCRGAALDFLAWTLEYALVFLSDGEARGLLQSWVRDAIGVERR